MMKKLIGLTLIGTLICLSHAEADTLPIMPGGVFIPPVIDNAQDMMHMYPAVDTLILPELNRDEEQKIVDLIQDKNRTYVTIKREVSVSMDNWELVGIKDSFDVWQLHIKSPGAIAMQTFFYEATLFPGLDIKIYSGEEGITSHIGEHKGNDSENAESFWSTTVPGNTVVIEVWAPQSSNLTPDGFPFEIKYINHHFREDSQDIPTLKYFTLGSPQQNTCTVFDNRCLPDNPWRAIAHLHYTEPDGTGTRCTSSFLSNPIGIDRPTTDTELFLVTAFHCIYPGSSQNMAKGTRIRSAEVFTSRSPCASADDRLVGTDIRFIAGNEKADWALLWVNGNSLSRADGQNLRANGPALLGWNANRLATGSIIETLHHTQGPVQNYAQSRVTNYRYAEGQAGTQSGPTNFEPCSNPSGCTHYFAASIAGGTSEGASGAAWWSPRYFVRGIQTHGTDTCDAAISRFDKMYEDGRVRCALGEGAPYYPNNTSTRDDSSRPSYSNSSGSDSSGGGGSANSSGGGGGSTGIWLIFALIVSLLREVLLKKHSIES